MKQIVLFLTSLLALPALGGELTKIEIDSKALGKKVPCNILLPEDYAESADKRFPVVYLLHGYGGDYAEWERIGIVEEARGLEAIIVMPEGNKSFYVNHAGSSKEPWENYIVQDVIGRIDADYRTVATRESRAINGLSMGGYGAVTLGLKHPELFASIASHSGALGILKSPLDGDIGKRIREIYGDEGSDARKLYEPLNLAAALAKEDRPHLYIDCGSQDFLLDSNRAFVKALAETEFPYEYHESPGKHDFAYWKANVRFALDRQLAALKEAAKNPRKVEQASFDLAGIWDSTAKTDNGKSEAVLTFKGNGKDVTGTLESENGPQTFNVIKITDGEVLVQIKIARDGQEGIIQAKGKVTDNDTLVGRWSMAGTDGTEYAGGDWTAKRRATEKAFDLAGKWAVVATLPDGSDVKNTTTFEKDGESFKGGSVNENGEADDFQSVAVDGDSVTIETTVPFGDITVTLKASAEGKKLAGKWSLITGDGQELGGDYAAEKQ